MRYPLISIGLTLAIGIAIGLILQKNSATFSNTPPDIVTDTAIVNSDPAAAADPNADVTTDSLKKLNRRLQNEIFARMAFEKRLEELSQKIADLELKAQLPGETTPTASNDNAGESNLPGSGQGWFNEQALVNNGISSSQASALKIQFEQLELERLYLRDQSIREGWDRDRYREALQTLTGKEDNLKDQMSESAYDAFLYASGQTNRVAVTSVLESAPAATAGIKPGDQIIRYDNQRIYNWIELREATSTGAIGDTVAVEVDRDGETMEFYVARGPLGVRMNSLSVAP
jgi:hypothetical protein